MMCMVEFIENTPECEYDCDRKECLATGCDRYGICCYTKTIFNKGD